MNSPRDLTAWLQGGTARCLHHPEAPPGGPWRLVLLGAPGVGKGSQAELLCARLGACHLSTGDIFRAARTSEPEGRTPALRTALECMHQGALVSDATVLDLVAERTSCLRCAGGFVLDGFPRTVAQAAALETLLQRLGVALDAVLDYQLPLAVIMARLGHRRVCPSCGATYHEVERPPRRAGVCDACGTALQQRDDDRPAAVKTRINAYLATIAPLLEFYRTRGLLVIVPADRSPEDVYAQAWSLAAAAGLRSKAAG